MFVNTQDNTVTLTGQEVFEAVQAEIFRSTGMQLTIVQFDENAAESLNLKAVLADFIYQKLRRSVVGYVEVTWTEANGATAFAHLGPKLTVV